MYRAWGELVQYMQKLFTRTVYVWCTMTLLYELDVLIHSQGFTKQFIISIGVLCTVHKAINHRL